MDPSDQPVILFDGVCNLCNASVRFVLERDPKERFKFASLQSDVGQALLQQHQLPTDLSTIVLLHGVRVWRRSSAALRVARHLSAAWPLMSLFLIVPPFMRDAIYRGIARNRYRWFGKEETCPLPDPSKAHRFLTP